MDTDQTNPETNPAEQAPAAGEANVIPAQPESTATKIEQLESGAKEFIADTVEPEIKAAEAAVATAWKWFPESGKRILLYCLLGLLALCLAALAYKHFRTTPAPVSRGYIAAAPAHGMANVPTHDVPVTTVKAYDKTAAAKKISLPPEIVADPRKELLTSAYIPPSEGGHTAATVLDTTTGESTTIVKEEPRPLFALGGKTEIGARFGVTTQGGEQAAVYARQDLVRVGPAYVAGYGEVNGGSTARAEAKAMIDVSVRW